VKPGGTAGQVLTKQSAADFDTYWQALSGGGGITLPLTQNLTFSPDATWNIGTSISAGRPYRIFAMSDLTLGNNDMQLTADTLASSSSLTLSATTSQMTFKTNNVSRWYIDFSGHFRAQTDNTYDIGTVNSTRPRSIYAATSVEAPSNYLYNMYTNASNYERLEINWSGNVAYLLSSALGTATQRPLTIGTNGGYLALRTSGTDRWTVQPTGHLVAAADNAYDIGASGANRPRDVYVADKLAVNATLPTGNTRFQVGGDGYITGLFGIGAGPQGGVALTVGGSNYGHGLWSTCAVNPAGNGWQIDAVRVDGVPTNTGSYTSVDYRSFYIGAITVPAGYAFNYGLYIGAPSGATTNLGLYNVGATQLIGTLNVGSNATPPTIKAFGASLSIDSRASTYVTGLSGTAVTGNAYFDGTNWQRYDTGQPATLVNPAPAAIYFYTAPAGANPIPWANRVTVDAASGLVTIGGNLSAANYPAGAWTAAPFTANQGGAVGATMNSSRWTQHGKTVIVNLYGQMTSAGVSGQVIQIILDNSVPPPLNVGGYFTNGVFLYVRSGVAFYTGAVTMAGGRTLQLMDSGQNNFLGATPAFGAVNGDFVSIHLVYETA